MRRNTDNPSTTFFWNDWDNEPGMKFCILAAQGLWVKMLSLAARSREYGVVLVGEHPSKVADLAPLMAPTCGESVEEMAALIDQLITFQVASVDDGGRLYNRRMVEEAKISAIRSDAGRKGADATNSKRQKLGKGVGKRVSKANGKTVGKTRTHENAEGAGQQAISSSATNGAARQTDGKTAGKTSPSSFFTLSSVSKDTGAAAPIDKRKVTFGACLAYLVQNGQDEPGARGLLGKWRQSHGDDAVHAAVDQAQARSISDPVPYIQACLRRSANQSQPVQRANGWEAQP